MERIVWDDFTAFFSFSETAEVQSTCICVCVYEIYRHLCTQIHETVLMQVPGTCVTGRVHSALLTTFSLSPCVMLVRKASREVALQLCLLNEDQRGELEDGCLWVILNLRTKFPNNPMSCVTRQGNNTIAFVLLPPALSQKGQSNSGLKTSILHNCNIWWCEQS